MTPRGLGRGEVMECHCSSQCTIEKPRHGAVEKTRQCNDFHSRLSCFGRSITIYSSQYDAHVMWRHEPLYANRSTGLLSLLAAPMLSSRPGFQRKGWPKVAPASFPLQRRQSLGRSGSRRFAASASPRDRRSSDDLVTISVHLLLRQHGASKGPVISRTTRLLVRAAFGFDEPAAAAIHTEE
jgi:hypothetical protein